MTKCAFFTCEDSFFVSSVCCINICCSEINFGRIVGLAIGLFALTIIVPIVICALCGCFACCAFGKKRTPNRGVVVVPGNTVSMTTTTANQYPGYAMQQTQYPYPGTNNYYPNSGGATNPGFLNDPPKYNMPPPHMTGYLPPVDVAYPPAYGSAPT